MNANMTTKGKRKTDNDDDEVIANMIAKMKRANANANADANDATGIDKKEARKKGKDFTIGESSNETCNVGKGECNDIGHIPDSDDDDHWLFIPDSPQSQAICRKARPATLLQSAQTMTSINAEITDTTSIDKVVTKYAPIEQSYPRTEAEIKQLRRTLGFQRLSGGRWRLSEPSFAPGLYVPAVSFVANCAGYDAMGVLNERDLIWLNVVATLFELIPPGRRPQEFDPEIALRNHNDAIDRNEANKVDKLKQNHLSAAAMLREARQKIKELTSDLAIADSHLADSSNQREALKAAKEVNDAHKKTIEALKSDVTRLEGILAGIRDISAIEVRKEREYWKNRYDQLNAKNVAIVKEAKRVLAKNKELQRGGDANGIGADLLKILGANTFKEAIEKHGKLIEEHHRLLDRRQPLLNKVASLERCIDEALNLSLKAVRDVECGTQRQDILLDSGAPAQVVRAVTKPMIVGMLEMLVTHLEHSQGD